MRTLLTLLVIGSGGIGSGGCGSKSYPAEPAAPRKVVMTVETVGPAPAPVAPPAPAPSWDAIAAELFGEGMRSVELRATSVVRKEADADSDKVGVIRKGTRSPVRSAAESGHGCTSRWIELAPRGWICEAAIAASREAATAAEEVSLTDEQADLPMPLPGEYGIVRGKDTLAYATAKDAGAGENGHALVGSHTVRKTAAIKLEGKQFWATNEGDVIDASSIAVLGPSRFKGIALAKDAPLPAWVHAKSDPTKPAITRATPAADGAPVGKLAPRTVVSILEESADGHFARIGEGAWIARADLRVASAAEPPPGTADGEKWFDVDLDEQVLVAYEGQHPVYATLVSTGRLGHTTPTLMARISSKHQATPLNSPGDKYWVADVPWTMFYDGGYALHTSYWHDGFGGTRSHGCVNLSPRDAYLLYQWSSPDVPPGWISVIGDEDHPGSLVRIHSHAGAEPELRGYAQKMQERSTLVAAK